MVFTHLRRKSKEVYYYHTKEGKEVDFLLITPDQKKHLFQVCISLKDNNTRKREVEALNIAMKELELSKGIIITAEEELDISVEAGQIECIPFWKLFISQTPERLWDQEF